MIYLYRKPAGELSLPVFLLESDDRVVIEKECDRLFAQDYTVELYVVTADDRDTADIVTTMQARLPDAIREAGARTL